MKSTLLCLLLLAVAAAVYADEPEALVSGVNADPNEFPYTVSIRQGGTHYCGGAIIGPRHILTAAHCISHFRKTGQPVTVVTGSQYLNYGGQAHSVEKMFLHSDFTEANGYYSAWYNDIGALKLTAPITYTKHQYAIALPTSNPPPYSYAVVSAWGKRGLYSSVNNALQKLSLQILPNEKCQQYHETAIVNSMICTYLGPNIGTCGGDSGSPLAYNGQLVGIVSGGIPCARGLPDIFTNVYQHMRFVREMLRL